MISPENEKVVLQFLLTSILIIGGLSWGILGMTGYNPISQLSNALDMPILTRIIYTLIGLATILYIFKYFSKLSVFMPSYDETYFPSYLLNIGQSPINHDTSTTIKAPKGATHLAYWHDTDNTNEYNDNWGITQVNNGEAEVKLNHHKNHRNMNDDSDETQVYYRWVGNNKLGKIHSMML